MISPELLKNYQSRALGVAAYGNGGLEKSFATRTFVPPICDLDFEGGTGCLGPWTRRVRKWDGKWIEYSDADRMKLFDLVSVEKRNARALLKPAPYIDIISFDVLSINQETHQSPSYDEMFKVISNLDFSAYNSVAVDPLIEFSQLTQAKSKAEKGATWDTPMQVSYWGPAQERAAILLRRLRNYRDQGIFIYLTSSELIDKDYGTDPRSKKAGEQAEEPYAIKGSINVPGQLVRTVNHMIDIQVHVRMMNGAPVWVTQEEPARSGSFNWEAKDRTGRLADRYIRPNMRDIIKSVYGEDSYKEIYESATRS